MVCLLQHRWSYPIELRRCRMFSECWAAAVPPPKRVWHTSQRSLLVPYDQRLYAFRNRLRFMLKRRLHRDSIE
jgi:hypothetical protein